MAEIARSARAGDWLRMRPPRKPNHASSELPHDNKSPYVLRVDARVGGRSDRGTLEAFCLDIRRLASECGVNLDVQEITRECRGETRGPQQTGASSRNEAVRKRTVGRRS